MISLVLQKLLFGDFEVSLLLSIVFQRVFNGWNWFRTGQRKVVSKFAVFSGQFFVKYVYCWQFAILKKCLIRNVDIASFEKRLGKVVLRDIQRYRFSTGKCFPRAHTLLLSLVFFLKFSPLVFSENLPYSPLRIFSQNTPSIVFFFSQNLPFDFFLQSFLLFWFFPNTWVYPR